MADYVGYQLGNYRLLQVIGQGGSADVYLGEHIHLGTLAAIKILHLQIGGNERENFLREARIIARLLHPHIVRVLDFGTEGPLPFLVMDYAPHGNLRQLYPRGTLMPRAIMIEYVKQVAQALQYAHEHKIVHRDVKPENMLLDSNWQILLSDFGISAIANNTNTAITQKRFDSATSGTISYMAPEQILGDPHPSSDQYALGVVVYEWLCGFPPFKGNAFAVMYQHVHTTPPPLHERLPAISPALEHVILQALAKDPRQRFASIEDFAQALEQSDQAQEAPTLLTRRPPATQPKPDGPLPQQKGSSLQKREMAPLLKDSSLRRGMAYFLIGAVLILVVGSVTLFFSSSRIPGYATPGTPTPHISSVTHHQTTTITYDTATTNGVMDGFNAQHTRVNPYEKNISSSNVSQLVPAWKAPADGAIGSAATVANGIVYINANNGKSHDGYMYAFSVKTGAMLWKAPIGSYDFGCAPTVANGIVYMGSFDNNLYAFNAKTGAVLWKAPTTGRIGSSPTLVNGVIYIGSDDGSLYAFNSSNGKKLWSHPTGSTIFSSPAFANGLVYVGSNDHKLYALDAETGTARWTFTTGDQVISSPTVSNGIVYVGSNDHFFYALNAQKGTILWKAMTGASITSSPAVSNDIVYIGSEDKNLYAFNASDGKKLWSVSTEDAIRSSPTIANGVLYIGSDDHKLYALDARTGAIRWTFTTGNIIVSSPTVANGAVYVGSNDGNLYAFHLANKAS